MFSRIPVIVLLTGISFVQAVGQGITVNGRFLADSIKIGASIPYSLTVRYPSDQTVLLPDTSFSFAPFEIQKKKYFQTKTIHNVSYDSVVYFLTTYEIDSLQKLRLPVFVVHPNDCTAVYSNTASVILKQLVKSVPDSLAAEKLPLRTNTDYLHVRWLLNYPLVVIIGAAGVVILIVGWIIFGKRIRRHFMMRRLSRNHAVFIRTYSELVDQLKLEFSSRRAELVFVSWKKYMENLVSLPYTKYTSREILLAEHDAELGRTLHAMNKIIYGGINPSSDDTFNVLRAYTDQQFHKKIEAIKHG